MDTYKRYIIWFAIASAIVLALAYVARGECSQAPAIVALARSQLGHGEVGGDNRGPEVRKYLNGRENLAWCAGFVSWCAREAGYSRYTLRARDFLALGQRVTWPRSGDIVVFSRKGGAHAGIVESADRGGFVSIEGNTGAYPSVVKRIKHRLDEKNILGFRRI